nr:30S ribosomal protein S19 [uncultured archaeon]
MAKEFSFQGKALKELQELSSEEFAKLLTARKRRSLKHGIDSALLKRVEKALKEKNGGKEPKTIRTHKRNAIIIHGHEFAILEVQPEMLGHVLGEFALTRKRLQHGKAGIGATKSSTAVQARG